MKWSTDSFDLDHSLTPAPALDKAGPEAWKMGEGTGAEPGEEQGESG